MPMVKLGEVAREYKETCKGDKGDLPIVGLEHLIPEDINLTCWSDDKENTFTKMFRKGHVLFGRRRAYLKKAAVAPFDGICSGDITVIEAIEDKLYPGLLPFIIQNDALFDFAVGKSAGSLSPRVKWQHLQDYEFFLPEMAKQKELAELLWAMDRTKQAYKQLISATDELVKSQFIEMFGSPFESSSFKSEPLKENATLINGRAYKQEELLKSGKYPVLRVGNFFSNESWYYSDLELEQEKYCDNGDLLFAWSATFGPKIWDGGKVIYHYHIWKIIVGERYDKQFLCTLLEMASSLLINQTHGTTMLHLTKSGIESTSFIVPPLKVQKNFSSFIRQTDKSKYTLSNLIRMEVPHMFNEDNTIEQMVLATLQENGWKYIEAEKLPRHYSDVMVEPMVRDALIRLNPEIAEDPSRADAVIYKLRTLILSVQPHNLVTQNEIFKKLIFEENSYPFGKDGRMIPIRFFGTMTKENLALNEYVVTNQWVYPIQEGGHRFDIVLLINGFPIAIGELKTPVRSSVTWLDGASDIANYEKSVAPMFVTNVFNFATEGKMFRYGSVGMPVNMWGPWHTPDHKVEGTLADVKISIADMMQPWKIVDIFQFFTLFATDKKYRKYKIICRYQQYEGANLIVERVKAGYPKKGLIWHFQGSGKSLLMVFAAQKLRMIPELKNPTVVIIDDRIDLETQITATFNASDIPNLVDIATKDELIKFFQQDTRKIAITTIFRFGDVEEQLNDRDNIVIMVDEAHRTQEGNLGEKMRLALPNAFFFGLTGTPINRLDKNTFKTFGAIEDKSGYMSKYSFSDSIRDHATLPLHFEPVPVDLHVDREKLDAEFDALTDSMSEEQKTELSKRVNMKAIMYDADRIRKVCEHIAKHYREKVEPNGYKAQLVVFDRECCLLYKAELDRLLGEDATTIVMDTNNDKSDRYKAYRRSRDEEAKLLDFFREPTSPLKIVIVTAKLLTGFDAPILQVMYLDKPMKDHNLLQAICRTNRTYDEGKTHGLIVDYIGIFDNVAKALEFDEAGMKKVITNIEEVKNKFPELMAKCLEYFIGVDRTIDGWEGLMAAQECIPTNEDKDSFGADYRVLNRVWNSLSPDPFLASYKFDYQWLTRVYESVKPTTDIGGLIWASLGAKTMELVHENLIVGDVHEDEEILELDAELIDEYIEKQKDLKKTTMKVEIDLVARIQAHSKDPRFIKLGEKLEELRDRHERGLIASVEFLRRLLVLAREARQAEKEVVPEQEIDKGRAALTELFNGLKNDKTPIIVERIITDIDSIVKIVRFDGWQNTTAGQKEVKKALRSVIWNKYKIHDNDVFNKAYSYIEEYY